MFPDFIGLGAQKSGSTWLDRALEAHPEIWMPPRKEIHYFDRPLDWIDPPIKKNRSAGRPGFRRFSREGMEDYLWTRRFKKTPRSDEWYASLFRPRRGQICGEITPEYALLDREKVAHVHGLMPDAKLFFILRNPIERTWSHALMDLARAGYQLKDITLEIVEEFASRSYVKPKSRYLKTLETWTEFYPPEKIFIGFLEDIELYPLRTIKKAYGFLGVDASFSPPKPGKKVNARGRRKGIPHDVARSLARSYREPIQELPEVFGEYTDFWLYCADSLLEGKPTQQEKTSGMESPMIRTPLWQSWRETLPEAERSRTDYFASRPLSEFKF